MFNFKFVMIFELLNIYLRDANKAWSFKSKKADAENEENIRKQLLIDTVHIIKVLAALFHPFAPKGCDMVKDYLKLNDEIYNWDNIFKPVSDIIKASHEFEFLPPKTDFFVKHESQY